MKIAQLPLIASVQSITDQTGRRILRFKGKTPGARLAQVPVKRRKSPYRLKLLMAPEVNFRFESVIRIRPDTNF